MPHFYLTPAVRRRLKISLAARLARRVRRGGPGECWPWTGPLDDGYGRIGRGSSLDGTSRLDRPHRVAWELANGRPVPTWLEVMHECDNPACCNPSHLRVGTHDENMADMASKARSGRLPGAKNGRAKLTAEAAAELRRRKRYYGSLKAWASEFGVGLTTIKAVLGGNRW